MPLKKFDDLLNEAGQGLKGLAGEYDRKIPSVRSLSRFWGVSTTTANRILKSLADRKTIIKDNRRNRYYFNDQSRSDVSVVPQPTPADRVDGIAVQLQEHLIEDEERRAEPFSIRRVMRDFHCSYTTASRVLVLLERRGWLVRNERGTRARPSPTPSKAGASVYVICYKRSHYESFGSRFLNELERTIASSGYGSVQYAYANTARRYGLPPRDKVAGFICLELRHFVPSLRAYRDIPAAFVWKRSRGEMPLKSKRPGDLWITIDNKAAGLAVAEHLHAMHHRHIAVFSHLSAESTDWVHDRITAMKGLFPDGNRHVSLSVFPKNGVSGKAFAGYQDPLNKHQWKADIPSTLNRTAIARAIPFEITKHLFSNAVHYMQGLADLADNMHDAFSQALREKDITAWVCLNDDLAICAYQFLQKRSIAIPGRIMLAGFDNSPWAAPIGLSSYDFNPEAIARTSAHRILHPTLPAPARTLQHADHGRLVVRGSSGRRVPSARHL